MKKIISVCLVAILLLGALVGCGAAQGSAVTDDPADNAKQWIETQIKKNTLFSFVYDGKDYADHIKNWEKTVGEKENAWTVTYSNGDVTVWTDITFNEEMTALEWTNYFKNNGSVDSPVISDIQVIDSVVQVENPILTSAQGSDLLANDFQPFSIDMTVEESFKMASMGGRSSHGAFPYFDIYNGEYGDIVGNNLGTGVWREQVGNWYFIPDGYPSGNAQKIGEALKNQDKEFILWFELERAMPGTKLTVEHPEWFIAADDNPELQFMLFNLAIDEACDYLINWIGTTLKESGVTWYRQDANFQPDTRWKLADKAEGENRIGITEIKYITNEYRFLDGLREMNPGLMIDSCASGGRRLDLEMMKRSIPLWNSDYTTHPESATVDGNRALCYNLTWWIPIHAGGGANTSNWDLIYRFRAAMMSGMQLTVDVAKNGIVRDTLVDQYYACRELITGDYYILQQGLDKEIETKDACYEFYMADQGKGYLMAFRPANCPTEVNSYCLKGLDPDANYELEAVDTGDKLTMTGEQLMTDGLKVEYPKAGLSLLIYINKI